MALIAGRDAHVVVNLATGPAGPGVAHLPEIIFGAKLENAIFGNTLRKPQVIGLRIARHSVFAFENRDVQLPLIDPEPLRRSDQLPGISDCVLLEVIPKREISQHLKKRVVAIREANVFKIVMLPPRAHAFLRSRRPRILALFEAQKDVLELVHSSIGKEQRRVIGRDQRRGVHLAMPLLNEEV